MNTQSQKAAELITATKTGQEKVLFYKEEFCYWSGGNATDLAIVVSASLSYLKKRKL